MAEVTLTGVRKVFAPDTVAVQDFNLEILDGEFVVLVGPSGCGKSTTLRMIAGLETLTSGRIEIGGRVANDLPPAERDIAMVFQNYALYPHMTVAENMAFGLKLRKFPVSEIEERVKEAADILDIGNLLARKPEALSGGQRQRVAVGRAIVRKPKVFLFDEPLSNLDAKLRAQTRAEISQLHDRLGATMIYVTHDQVEAMTMGDRLVVMEEGVVRQIGAPGELYRRPANRFVAGFIGSPAMNLLEAELAGSEVVRGSLRLSVAGSAKDRGNANVVLGIRPEHIGVAAKQNEDSVMVQVDVVEPLGHETFVYFKIDDAPLVARLAGDVECAAGDELSMVFDSNAIHLFDAETGETVTNDR